MEQTRQERTLSLAEPTFEQVFEDEYVTMVRLAFMLLHSEALAQEAAQDAFAKLLDRFNQVSNPGGFVRTVTVNRCHDIARKTKTEARFLKWQRPPEHTTNETSELDDVLANLDYDRRVVIVLRFYLGHEPKEIAQILDIPEGTVRSRIHRGLKELKGKLS